MRLQIQHLFLLLAIISSMAAAQGRGNVRGRGRGPPAAVVVVHHRGSDESDSSSSSSSLSAELDNIESTVGDVTQNTVDMTDQATQDTIDATENAAQDTVDATENAAQDTVDATENLTQGAVDETLKLTDATLDAIAPSDQNAWAKSLQANPTGAPPSTSIRENDPETGITTVGVLEYFEEAALPIDRMFYVFLDSLLRNTRDVGLPCTIYSFIPLEGECTPYNKKS